jgi:DNA helicase HerA-like ATPase
VNRFMRDPQRDRSVPTVLIIDEFGYASQVESVARMAADICKVARKYGIGLIVADQNPHTFQTTMGKEIMENAVGKILFHLDDSPAQVVGTLISDLTPGHVAFLPKATRGQAVAVFGNDVYLMHVESSPLEHRQFQAS